MSDFGLAEDEFWEAVGPEVDGYTRVSSWQQLIDAKGENLDSLSESSQYYRWVVDFIKADPARADRLSSWNFGPRTLRASSNSWDKAYFASIREDFDGVFMIQLFNGDPGAVSLYEKLTPDQQKQLVDNTIRIFGHAMYEQWAYGAAYGTTHGESNNPYLGYYDGVVPNYN